MTLENNHITVCICTYKRPNLLKRLLRALDGQETLDLFSYSLVVADNDHMQSAQTVVTEFAAASALPVTYCMEPQQNIALARNKALRNAKGNFIAFIDDDELPASDWLRNLFAVCNKNGVDGVLGPVKPYFEHQPPEWVIKGRFFERPTHHNGYKMNWREGRTGNVLFRRDILNGIEKPFAAEFGMAGEDVDFFRRMMEKGRVFVWCNEAIVHEVVPPSRCKRSYLLRRALLRGNNVPKHPKNRIRNLAKSLVAVPSYTLALPVLAVFGQHIFLRYLIKLFDHTGRLLAFLRLNPVRERELTT